MNPIPKKAILSPKRPSERYIPQYERDMAAMLLDAYKTALAAPDGRYCLNPEAPDGEQVVLRSEQVLDYLLYDLERIKDHGTLHFTEPDTNSILIQLYFKEQRARGLSYEKAVEATADRYPLSERTVRRIVDKAKI